MTSFRTLIRRKVRALSARLFPSVPRVDRLLIMAAASTPLTPAPGPEGEAVPGAGHTRPTGAPIPVAENVPGWAPAPENITHLSDAYLAGAVPIWRREMQL